MARKRKQISGMTDQRTGTNLSTTQGPLIRDSSGSCDDKVWLRIGEDESTGLWAVG